MGVASTGVVINSFIALVAFASGEYPEGFCWFMGAFAALSVLGLVLAATGDKRLGAGLVVAGSVVFVPIGLIGAFGGMKILNQLKQDEFETRGANQ